MRCAHSKPIASWPRLAAVAVAVALAAPGLPAGAQVKRAAGGAASGGSSHASGTRDSAASASGHTSASSASGNATHASSRTNRSVSVSENGKKIAISENSRSGISVTTTETVDGKEKTTVVRAANVTELAKKSSPAHELYQRYLGRKTAGGAAASGGATASGAATASGKATRSSSRRSSSRAGSAGATGSGQGAPQMLRQQLREMQQQNADNPQLKQMLDEAIRELDNAK